MRRAALAGLVLLLFVRADIVSAQSATPTIGSTGLALAPGQFDQFGVFTRTNVARRSEPKRFFRLLEQ